MRFRIRLPLPWTLVATLFAVAISSAGGKTGATTATTPTITSTTTKSGPTTSTPSREESLARMVELRNNMEHLRGQLGGKQARQSTLNGVTDWDKKQARDVWLNATEELDLSEKRKNESQEAKDDPTASKSPERKALDDVNREWETANETVLNSTNLLEEAIQDYNSTNFTDIDTITWRILESEREMLEGILTSCEVEIASGREDEAITRIQQEINNTNDKLQKLSVLKSHWEVYNNARRHQGDKGRAVKVPTVRLNNAVLQLEAVADLLPKRIEEFNVAKAKAGSALTSLIKVEADLNEREKLHGEIKALSEELNQVRGEFFRLEEMTRTPPPRLPLENPKRRNSIPRGRINQKANEAYEPYKETDRPWRFLCKPISCDNTTSDLIVFFAPLLSLCIVGLVAQHVYYCWDEGRCCFKGRQRDEVAKNGKAKEAKEEKPERKLHDVDCSA